MPAEPPYVDLSVEELRDDVARAHRALDDQGVPRSDDHGEPLSLTLRIAVLANAR